MKKFLKFLICIVLLIIIILICKNFINTKRKNYTIEKVTESSYFTLLKDGKVGVIDKQGNIIINPDYIKIQIPNPSKDVFICTKNDQTKVTLNSKNEEIFKNYQEVSAISVTGIIGEIPYEKSVLKYKSNDLYGLLSFDGKEITKPIYKSIESVPYKEGELLVQKDEKKGVINNKGVKLVDFDYDSIIGDGYASGDNFKEAGYIVGKNIDGVMNYGYLDLNSKLIVPIEYSQISRLNIDNNKELYLILTKNSKKGLFKNKKIILDNVYDELEYNSTIKLIKVRQGEKYGVYNLDGKIILRVDYQSVEFKGIYISAVKENKKYNYDRNGIKMDESNYSKVIPTDNKDYFVTVANNGLYGIVNIDGVETASNKFVYIQYLINNYFIVYNKDNVLGVIDQYGNSVLPFQYNIIQVISGTQLIQANNTDKGVLEIYSSDMQQLAIMKNGKVQKMDNYIRIWSDTETKYLNLDGKLLSNKEALENNNLFAVSKYGLWGFEDKDGKIVVDEVYEAVTEFNEYGFAGIKQNGKWGVIDSTGKIIVAPMYEIPSDEKPDFIGKYYKINYGGEIYYTDENV